MSVNTIMCANKYTNVRKPQNIDLFKKIKVVWLCKNSVELEIHIIYYSCLECTEFYTWLQRDIKHYISLLGPL